MKIQINKKAGDFAENKDVAATIRVKELLPALAAGEAVVIDFTGVRLTTQSFVHALISDALRRHGEGVLDVMEFKGCSKLVQGIIETVVQYSLETIDDAGDDG